MSLTPQNWGRSFRGKTLPDAANAAPSGPPQLFVVPSPLAADPAAVQSPTAQPPTSHFPAHPPGARSALSAEFGPTTTPALPRGGHASAEARMPAPGTVPLGERLVAAGALAPADLVRALNQQQTEDSRLGSILLAQEMVRPEALMACLAEQWHAQIVALRDAPPDTRLLDAWGTADCLGDGLVPWRRMGGTTVIVTARPECFAGRRAALEATFGPVAMALAPEDEVIDAVITLRGRQLARRAETRAPELLSCRAPAPPHLRYVWAALGAAALAMLLLVPGLFGLLMLGWAALTLIAVTGLKGTAAVLALRRTRSRRSAPPPAEAAPTQPAAQIGPRLPVISVMVPLFHEERVASRLLQRLERLTYPRALTDILLVCEEDDITTADTLAATQLPPWVRVVRVPRGGVQTKPRALNYALDFCRGPIVGVWDAEDAPAPDQLHRVALQFQRVGPDVACLQGVLDYYNSPKNWMSRCFTIEYAAWFRAFLPMLQALRLPIPLGGTTLFFRRDALERLGGWDAHNVTEDADLGLRLCRAGYRTELVNTVTEEEANSAVFPWIRQRSRWLKGYGLTWAVHMRDPLALWRDLGPRGFFAVQILFLGTLSQFILAPVLWTFWPMVFGLWHPLAGMLPQGTMMVLVGLFIFAELVSMTLAYAGLIAAGKTRYTGWILTLPAYFPLAVAACYQGVWESLRNPFFWHKTAHGLYDADPDGAAPDGAT